MDAREEELIKMRGIKGRAVKADLSFRHVIQLVGIALWTCLMAPWECMKAPRERMNDLCKCMKALREYMKVRWDDMKALWKDMRAKWKCMKALWEFMKNLFKKKEHEMPEKKLATELEGTLKGLKELDHFLEAVEKLAVTSLHVFMEENQVLHLPKGISLKHVQDVIIAAQQICPLLLKFKRDASDFFLPKLQNVEVFSDQLDNYIKTTWKICDKLEKSLYVQIPTTETVVDLHVSEEGVPERLCGIELLNEIRMGEHFRTVFLFKYRFCSDFIDKFSGCEPRMLKSLKHLDGAADNLNYLNQVAKTFSVLSSLVGIGGGSLSIYGLALSPATEGVPPTKSGAYLGILSTVIIALAFIIELCWDYKQKKAKELFQSFMADMQSLQHCLKEETSHQPTQIQESEIVVGESKVFGKARAVIKFIDLLADIEGASDIPYICQTAVKKPFDNLFLIGANVLSLVTDAFFICKQGYSLVKCSETEVSKIITARAAVWRSQLNSWKKIHDLLCEGQRISEEHRAVLDKLFNQRGQ
ncbi:uncharacterized protein LOC115574971 [Sparus aurata]|uniref:Uncharacterized LOC115574971 n=1 Tax=Sparus aurata TaxID=8175 RepID=A0A671Z0U8_SPAAU|nr:uncharacterized protein LOC115574971 [Sparus aurata]